VPPAIRHCTADVTVEVPFGAPAARTDTVSVVVWSATGASSDGAPYPNEYDAVGDALPNGPVAVTVTLCPPAFPPTVFGKVTVVFVVGVGWVTDTGPYEVPSIVYRYDTAAAYDAPDAASNVAVHDSAAFTVEPHDPFADGHKIVGVGGASVATRSSRGADHADHNDPSNARDRSQTRSFSFKSVVKLHVATVPAAPPEEVQERPGDVFVVDANAPTCTELPFPSGSLGRVTENTGRFDDVYSTPLYVPALDTDGQAGVPGARS